MGLIDDASVRDFLDGNLFAVCGASERRQKYGNQIFRALLRSGRVAIPLNPVADQVEGCTAYRRLEQIPECPESVCLVTPPSVTLSFVQEAIELGVRSLWVQPGAQHSEAGQLARDAGINVIDDGRCILVALLEL